MSIESPPAYEQNETYPAEQIRRATFFETLGIVPIELGSYGLGSWSGAPGTKGEGPTPTWQVGGTKLGSDFAITPGTGLQISVAGGQAIVPPAMTDTQGPYYAMLPSAETISLSTADATNPRIDTVVLSVYDDFYAGASNSVVLQVIEGTPSSGATLSNLTGAGVPPIGATNYILGYVLVPALATSLVLGDIRQESTMATSVAQLAARGVLFTQPGTFTLTTPDDGVTHTYKITCIGGGGGGGPACGAAGGITGGAGGGGEGSKRAEFLVELPPATQYTITVGEGGDGGTVSGTTVTAATDGTATTMTGDGLTITIESVGGKAGQAGQFDGSTLASTAGGYGGYIGVTTTTASPTSPVYPWSVGGKAPSTSSSAANPGANGYFGAGGGGASGVQGSSNAGAQGGEGAATNGPGGGAGGQSWQEGTNGLGGDCGHWGRSSQSGTSSNSNGVSATNDPGCGGGGGGAPSGDGGDGGDGWFLIELVA